VTVQQTEGSTPRERGAWMAVAADAVVGTIGGGHLEFQAIAEARRRPGGPGAAVLRYALGPSLGQCCGGVVHLRYEQVTQADAAALRRAWRHGRCRWRCSAAAMWARRWRVLAPLPFALTWIDSRDGVFPPDVAPGVACEHSDPVQAAVPAWRRARGAHHELQPCRRTWTWWPPACAASASAATCPSSG
jgi:xanthine dehydrogenase accessory factor